MNLLLDLFKNDLFVEIDIEYLRFRKAQRSIMLQTYAWLSLDDHPLVLAIGKDYVGPTPAQKVHLFSRTPAKSDPHLLLASFIKYGFMEVSMQDKGFIRPKAFVKGVSKLDSVLCGYQNRILEQSFRMVGARDVVFE